MPFITQGKTNWKFLLIVVVLAAIVGGGILWWQYRLPPEEEICKNLCGDEICQEVVCLVVGCPCPETKENCPQDCGTGDETADWQTYRNDEYGFEFKYPSFLEPGEPGCEISEIEDIIFIGPISLRVFDAQGLTLNEWIDKEIAKTEEDTKEMQERFKQAGYENWQEFGSKLLSREEIFIAGEKAVKLSYQFIGAGFDLPVTISIKKGDRIYEFRTNDANLVDEECAAKFGKKPSEAMELMLSTFRFIEYVFPDDFILSADELPEGFTLMQIGEREKKLGLKSNPGFWDNPEIYKELYEDVDSTKIKHLYVSLYEVLEREFGIFLVQYNSAEDLDLEIPKIIQAKEERFRFLRKEEVIAFIWTDGSNYNDLDSVADLMENRLKFEQI